MIFDLVIRNWLRYDLQAGHSPMMMLVGKIKEYESRFTFWRTGTYI